MEFLKSLLTALLVALGYLSLSDVSVLGETVEVIVGPGLTFDPKHQEVNVGDTILWKWAYPDTDGAVVPHTVTKSISLEKKCEFVEDKKKEELKIFHSKVKHSGDTYEYTFTEVEEVTYHCETTGKSCTNCQGGMWGQVTVKEEGAKPKKPSKKYKMKDDSGAAKTTKVGTDAQKKTTEAIGKSFLGK